MATSYWSGTDTQLIPSDRIKYTDGTYADTRVFDRVTQASHGFTGRVPVYYNTTSSLWVAAQANAVGTIATHIAKVVDSNTLDVVLNGKVTDTSHGLTAGQYYFTSSSSSGTLTTTEPTTQGTVSNPMLYVVDANTYWVLGWRPTLN